MRRTSYISIAAAVVLAVCSCQSEFDGARSILGNDAITFGASIDKGTNNDMTKASPLRSADGSFEIPLWTVVTDGIGEAPAEAGITGDGAAATRGAQLNTTGANQALATYASQIDSKFYVAAWEGTGRFIPAAVASGTQPQYEQVSYSAENGWTSANTYRWKDDLSLTFYAYANLPATVEDEVEAGIACGSSTEQVLTYSVVPADATKQNDILMGYFTGTGDDNKDNSKKLKKADIIFYHPMTAVRFVKGDFTGADNVKFKAIYLSQIYKSGTATMTPASIAAEDPGDKFVWTNLSETMQQAELKASGDGYLAVDATTSVIGEPFIIIPQDLESKPVKIVIEAEIDGVTNYLSTICDSGIWAAGRTNTYKLSKDGYDWEYAFEFSEEPSPEVATRAIDDNKETSKTKTVMVTSHKTREDDPDNPVNVSWKILSYKLEGESSAVTVNDTEFTDTESGMTVTAGTDRITVTAAARDKVGKGTNEYWTRTSPTEDAGWSPADWSSTATWSNPIDLSKFNYQTDTPNNFDMTTANCYVIRHAGTYKLPLVYGNAVNGGNTNALSYYPNADGSMNTGTDALTNGEIEDITIAGESLKVRLVRFQNHLGNDITDPFIENNAGCAAEEGVILWQSDGDVVKDLQLVGAPQTTGSYTKDNVRYLQFTVNQNTVCQNVTLIALLNASGTVMWSWQIWTINDPAITQNSIEVRNFENKSSKFFPVPNIGFIEGWTYMPRKSMEITLQQDGGATITLNVEQPQIEQQPFNALYQFGRKDPTCSKEDVYYFNRSILDKPISTYGPVPPGEPGEVTLASYIQNPCTFYMFNLSPMVNYGLTLNYPYRNLWSGKNCYEGAQDQDANLIKTVYDPSPIGYKVPAGKAFTGFTMTGGNFYGTIDPFSPEKVNGYYDHSGNAYFYTVPGVGHTTDGGETIRFTCTGIRAGGSGRIYSRSQGWYYSANVIDTSSGKSKPILLNFKFESNFSDMNELRPLADAGQNAHGVRPVIDVTMPNNPMQ